MSETASKGWSAWRAAVAAFVLLAVLFVSLNIIAGQVLRGAKLDFTENKVYSLTPASRDLLKSLDEPISLTFYYSRETASQYAPLQAYATRVRDLLETFSGIAGDKLSLRIVEPGPYSEEEDEARAAGITPASAQAGVVFFGLAGENAVDNREVISFFSPEREAFLEYDLAEMIDRLNRPTRPKAGLLTALPLATGPGGPQAMMQGQSAPLYIYRLLAESYELTTLQADMGLEDVADLDLLIIAQPPDLSDETLYAIDQFVLDGGRALVFVDPVAEMDVGGPPPFQGAPPMPAGAADALTPLLDSWGVAFASDQVVLDYDQALEVATIENGRQVARAYPLWIAVEGEDINTEDPAAAELSRAVRMGSAGYVAAAEGAATTLEPLLTSSTASMTMDGARVAANPQPVDLLRDFLPDEETYAYAARVTGPAASAYGAAPEGVENPGHLETSVRDINVVVVADTDMLDDRFYISDNGLFLETTADNSAFILNLIDNLLGSDALLKLRGRAPSDRPMTAVLELGRKADERFLREEQRLTAELADTEDRLAALEREGKASVGLFAAPTPEEQAEIARFQTESARIRRDLREVQRTLNRDIDALKGRMIFLNVWLIPLLFGGAALFWASRGRRKARSKQAPAAGGAS